jgi:signal transduction histidine kinase
MKQLVSWVVGACVGFGRACAVAVVALLVPALWAGFVALVVWWGGSPWAWTAPFVFACVGSLLLVRPVCRMFRALVARWTGVVIPAGYQVPGPVTQMSNGFWWNGFSYSRTAERAREEQRWRVWVADPATWRDLRFTAVVPFTAGVAAAVPPGGMLLAVLAPRPAGLLGLAVTVAAAPYAWRLAGPVAARFLGPSTAMRLGTRVDELTGQRADTTVAQAAEIRRIERDLHDGAQARLVALGLSLATAEKLMKTNPEKAAMVLREARADAVSSLSELRDLVRGISPPVLNERGLVDAVRAFAMDSPLEATVSADLRLRLDPPIEAALYFGIAELMANALKHARATRAHIAITRAGERVVVDVEDDGRGGATVTAGGGLAGLRRRLAVFDGTLEITSPAGGPTRATMAVPCASS